MTGRTCDLFSLMAHVKKPAVGGECQLSQNLLPIFFCHSAPWMGFDGFCDKAGVLVLVSTGNRQNVVGVHAWKLF